MVNHKKETFTVTGMACTGCEAVIEEALLGFNGIYEVKANFSKSEVTVTFDPGVIGFKKIASTVKDSGYSLDAGDYDDSDSVKNGAITKEARKDKPFTVFQFIGIVVVLIALYLIINSTVGFNFIPEVKSSMGYGVLFLVGLLTSLHCIAMCGGINLSQCVNSGVAAGASSAGTKAFRNAKAQASEIAKAKAFGNAKAKAFAMPSLQYNLGRVTSYTIIGGIVGAIGAAVSFTGWARGIVAVVSGLFMIIMGLSMTGLFPWINKITPRLPRVFREKTGKAGKGKGPFVVGLLNGLMPCGPLQAMQLYALGTGSFIVGASSMFFFSLGTVPLMFGLGTIVTILGSKFTRQMMKFSAVLVAVLGIVMLGRGLVLSGIHMPTFGVQSAQAVQNAGEVSIVDGVLNITSNLEPGTYPMITVQKGIPVVWNIKADKENINGCNRTMVIPNYDIQIDFKPGDNIIKFTPTESGTYAYSCWMGMIRGNITVIDDINDSDAVTSDAEGNTSGYKIPVDEIAVAEIKDGEQIVSIDMLADRFTPAVIVVQKNIEAVWVINGVKVNDDSKTLLFPTYNASIEIEPGENPLRLTPDDDFDFSTASGSFYGYVKVVEDISNINIEAIKKEVSEFAPTIQEYVDDSGIPACH